MLLVARGVITTPTAAICFLPAAPSVGILLLRRVFYKLHKLESLKEPAFNTTRTPRDPKTILRGNPIRK
jgi:hypothetical protein